MKKFFTLTVLVFTVFLSYTIFAQQSGSLRGNFKFSIPEKIQSPLGDPLPAGTYTIGVMGDFPTIDSAFNKLSIDGIAGEVALELIDTLYIAPTNSTGFLLNGPIPGANPINNINIRHGVDKNVTIEGNGNSVLTFMNTSYVNLDPGSVRVRPGGITIHALHNTQFNHNNCISFLDNSDHNVVQNITIIDEDNERVSVGIGFIALISSPFECPDSNLIYNNFIKKAAWGIYAEGSYGIPTGKGNIIRENFIGSETDSLIGWGIQLVYCQNTLVENNIIQNLKQTVIGNDIINVGINSYWGTGDIIRNNIVHNIKSITGYTSTGIQLSGVPGNAGINNQVYNNMVYDIQSTSTQSNSRVTGIQMWNQDNPKIYYNSVYLSGTGQNTSGSAAFYVFNSCSNVEAKNNIYVNTRDESPYCASAIYDHSTSNLTSDYNDLYYDDTNQNNCLVRIGTTNYHTLAEWQATGNDSISVTEMPNFVEPYLHINDTIPTGVDSGATPISEINADIDGDIRNPITPDIGADELDIITGVEVESTLPTVYVLEQNFPNPFNPVTTIGYKIPKRSFVTIKVYDVLGNEVTTLVNDEKPTGTYELKWNAANLTSGIYFYKLNTGNYSETKKMLLLK